MKSVKEALKKLLKGNEFEGIIKKAKGREKENAKQFYEAVKDLNDEQIDKVPALIFIEACKSWNVWQNLCFEMEKGENAE